MKQNLLSIYTHLENKKKVPIQERKNNKSISYEVLINEIDNKSFEVHKDIEEELKKIHDDYLSTNKKVEIPKESKEWSDQICYVNEEIAKGITDIVLFNMSRMFEAL